MDNMATPFVRFLVIYDDYTIGTTFFQFRHRLNFSTSSNYTENLLYNQELRHLFRVVINDDKYQAEWAVAGRKRSGKIFAFHGFDTYQFDQQNKISFLKVKLEK